MDRGDHMKKIYKKIGVCFGGIVVCVEWGWKRVRGVAGEKDRKV